MAMPPRGSAGCAHLDDGALKLRAQLALLDRGHQGRRYVGHPGLPVVRLVGQNVTGRTNRAAVSSLRPTIAQLATPATDDCAPPVGWPPVLVLARTRPATPAGSHRPLAMWTARSRPRGTLGVQPAALLGEDPAQDVAGLDLVDRTAFRVIPWSR